MGKVVKICIAEDHGKEMNSVREVQAVAGKGLINDRHFKNDNKKNYAISTTNINYNLDKNLRRLTKDKTYLELTEKEIELIELLNKNSFTKKKEILSIIWKYSKDADTHTVETHIYRLRKKIINNFCIKKFINVKDNSYKLY